MVESSITKSRIEWIDYYRSFGIILMIMGHIGFGATFSHFIHAFHMPMFFFISGFCFKHRTKEQLSFRSYVKRKAKSLLLPYVALGIILYIISACENLILGRPLDLNPLICLFSYNTDCGSIWFLTALFFADIVFFAIDRYIYRYNIVPAVVIMIALFGSIAGDYFSLRFPFSLGASFVGVGFIYLGYLFQRFSSKTIIRRIMNLKLLPTLILAGISSAFIFINGNVNMRKGTYSNILLFWFNAFLAIVVGINFTKMVYPVFQKNKFGCVFRKIGSNSIVYLCLNEMVIKYVFGFVSIFSFPTIIQNSAVLIFTMLILYFLNELVMHTRIKLLFGK